MPASIAVIGAGAMGTMHARTILRSKGLATVGAIIDTDAARAQALAEECGAPWSQTLETSAALADCEVAIVAAPTAVHRDITCALLERGIHVLVEKPMAPSSADALAMIEAAQRSGAILAVGHVERFNPASAELSQLVEKPLYIQTHRLSPFEHSRQHEGVIFDLMLHDLDLMQQLDPSPVVSVTAQAMNPRSDTEDLATCTMRLESGLLCQFNVSRISQRKVRTMTITMQNGVLDADLLMRTIQVSRDTSGEVVETGTRRYRQRTVTEIPWMATGGEPLMLQLEEFVGAVRERRSPRVTGEIGLRAVELCEQVHHAALDSDTHSSRAAHALS